MGSYAELRKPEWLDAQMTLKEFDCADLARRINAEYGSPARPQVVSRQFLSQLKTGRKKRCTAALAQRICWGLSVDLDMLFVVHEPPNRSAQVTQVPERIPA